MDDYRCLHFLCLFFVTVVVGVLFRCLLLIFSFFLLLIAVFWTWWNSCSRSWRHFCLSCVWSGCMEAMFISRPHQSSLPLPDRHCRARLPVLSHFPFMHTQMDTDEKLFLLVSWLPAVWPVSRFSGLIPIVYVKRWCWEATVSRKTTSACVICARSRVRVRI